jgi:predicted porin
MKVAYTLVVFLMVVMGLSVAKAADLVEHDVKSVVEEPNNAEPSMFKLGGFGTLGVSHSSQSLGDYILDSTQPKGAGRNGSWFAGNDSRLGAQLTANVTANVSGVVQVISEYQADGTYRPAVEWANVKYAFSPDAYVRIGRIALPTFLNSDSRKVGYSYPWIHPPVDLYRVLSITNSDGIDAMYRFQIGEAGNAIKILNGKNTIDRPTSISESQDMWGVFDTLEYGSALLRVGYQKRIASSYNLLTGVQGAWVPNSDLSLGASYDPGNWFVMSEWIQRKSTTKLSAMYVSAGVRVDKFTPYLTYSNNGRGSFLPGFPPPTAASVLSANRSQSTTSMGVRWDFMKHADFKVQYDLVKLSDSSNGYLANLPVNTVLYGTSFHVVSAVVDFVF